MAMKTCEQYFHYEEKVGGVCMLCSKHVAFEPNLSSQLVESNCSPVKRTNTKEQVYLGIW